MIKADKTILENFRFVDLFAGIGGFHLALSSFGAKCVFASEWDKHAVRTYQDNFGLLPEGDITAINEVEIPPHEILCAGFPCQSFSVAGKQKGFNDTRGNSFFDVARIVKYHQPKILFLENVKNIVKHDSGNTLKIIIKTIVDLGYEVFWRVLNSSHFGLPQNRERFYLVAFHKELDVDTFEFPLPINSLVSLSDVLDYHPQDAKVIERDDIEMFVKPYQFSKIYPQNRPIQIGKVNKGGQGERIYHPLGHAITLSAHGGGVGSKTGLYLINEQTRKLSPRECARLQGFPENYIINDSLSQAYKQFGNSVSVNVLQQIIEKIGATLIRKQLMFEEKTNLLYA